jgi:hypothetical protein
MKREVMFIFIFVFFLLSVSLIYASEEDQVQKAYSCLETRINQTNCSTSFSFEDKAFSFLATGDLRCQKEIMLQNLSNQCWPKSGCDVKSTAQAILGLNVKEINTTKAENWLLTQTAIPTDMDWFLEIESLSSTNCTVVYSSAPYTVSIGSDKKISSNAGTYLTLVQDNYWLQISPSIYNKNITVSCDKPFITTLLFRKKDSSTIHVSETVHSSSANGKTSEIVDSFCFSSDKKVCDYEGSLWATFVLHSVKGDDGYFKYDVSKFMPYLITMMDDTSNQKVLPESFLYFLTGKFRTELLLKQTAGLYWDVSMGIYNEYYDTALALWPFYYESPLEKDNSKSWLLDVQQNTGCWNNGNVRDTAFLLYSIWPRDNSPFNPPGECTVASDCPEVSCKEASCNEGVCFYDYLDCANNDGLCCGACTIANDNDCNSGENICASDSDCSGLDSNSNNYCSDDNTKVYKNVSTWGCNDNKVCIEDVSKELVETCSSTETCYAGNCLSNSTTPDECITSYDCSYDETCSNGVCVSTACTSNTDCASGESCISGVCTQNQVLDCQNEGYFCMSQANCGGNILYNYSCTGVFECCDTQIPLETCSNNGGSICSSSESCTDGTIVEASDTVYGETCCLGGTCQTASNESSLNCADNGGVCKSSCGTTDTESSLYTCSYGESCCIAKSTTSKTSHAWIWILLVLILISALGIVFRDKLRTQWMKLKDKFVGKKDRKKFEMPLISHSNPSGRILPRRIFPPSQPSRAPINRPVSSQHAPINKKPEEKNKNELDDVLKKLKEMGK